MRQRVHGDAEPDGFRPADAAALELVGVALIEPVPTEIVARCPLLYDRVGDEEQTEDDGRGGPLLPPAACDPTVRTGVRGKKPWM